MATIPTTSEFDSRESSEEEEPEPPSDSTMAQRTPKDIRREKDAPNQGEGSSPPAPPSEESSEPYCLRSWTIEEVAIARVVANCFFRLSLEWWETTLKRELVVDVAEPPVCVSEGMAGTKPECGCPDLSSVVISKSPLRSGSTIPSKMNRQSLLWCPWEEFINEKIVLTQQFRTSDRAWLEGWVARVRRREREAG